MSNSQKWWNISAAIFVAVLTPFAGVGLAKVLSIGGGSYTIQCAVITPDGPIQTVNLKAHDVTITDFGIVKTKEGIYIPTTNEICVITKADE